MRAITFWLVCFFAMGIVSASADKSDLSCKPNKNGFLIYNDKTKRWIGEGSLFKGGTCREALDTYRSRNNIVCSWQGNGWAVHDADTGNPIGESGNYWPDVALDYCKSALTTLKEDIVCTPRGKGSGIFDLKHGEFVGNQYYFNINDCTWSSYSASETEVCAPHRGQTAVFIRHYNRPKTDDIIATAKECYDMTRPAPQDDATDPDDEPEQTIVRFQDLKKISQKLSISKIDVAGIETQANTETASNPTYIALHILVDSLDRNFASQFDGGENTLTFFDVGLWAASKHQSINPTVAEFRWEPTNFNLSVDEKGEASLFVEPHFTQDEGTRTKLKVTTDLVLRRGERPDRLAPSLSLSTRMLGSRRLSRIKPTRRKTMKAIAVCLVCFFAIGIASANAKKSDLSCKRKGKGHLIFNKNTSKWIGNGYILKGGTCREALDTYRPSNNIVCSRQGKGWAVHEADTGDTIGGEPSNYWYKLSYCKLALSWLKEDVVCTPRRTGSGIFDLEYEEFIGDFYYFDIDDCTWSSLSASATEVCAPHLGYTAIFNRRHNTPKTGNLITTAKQCYEATK